MLVLLVSVVPMGAASRPPMTAAPGLDFSRVWTQTVSDGTAISLSSPNVATLAGAPAVVVGDRGGYIYAFSLSLGVPVRGWPASTGGVPVGSTPSVAALQAGSPNDTIFIGAGYAGTPHEGGYMAFNPNGTPRWSVGVHNPTAPYVSGIVASLAVGDLQGGGTDVVAPSIGEEQDAVNATTGKVLPGFPWFQADGDYATPALADLYGNGKTEIIEGGGQTGGNAYGVQYPQGGHIRVVSATGNAGTGRPGGGLQCNYNPGQSVDSSPAVGRFLKGNSEGIVVGTGNFWPHAPGTDEVFAVNAHCAPVWSARLDGLTTSSPALADLSGNRSLDVVEGTNNLHGGGSVYALSGATGAVLWQQAALGAVMGGVATADLGAGQQDVIVAGTGGAEVLDGRNGAVLAILEKGVGLQNSPLVTDDPNGEIGITVAGYNAYNVGEVEHYELAGSVGADADQPGGWPMFHHDPRLSGNAES
jgi:hypothetical protein